MLQTRTPTAEEQEWLKWVGQLPCIVCKIFHWAYDSPAEIHHIDGRTKPGAHLLTIPLCAQHHREADTSRPKRWISRHGDPKGVFEGRYALEHELLELVRAEVKELKKNHIGEPQDES